MAKKGQKFKKYCPELKENILKEYFDGELCPKSLSVKYSVSIKTIWNWIHKTRHEIDVKVDHRLGHSGRPKDNNLTLEDYKERYEILKKYQAFLQARREKK
jgi:transposase-like protein